MTVFLRERAITLTERMDEPDCDSARLRRTYAQFTGINRLVAGWDKLYRERLRPEFAAGAETVLDIGCGGGDILRLLAGWAAQDGFAVQFTGIDPDERAIAFAHRQTNAENITFCPLHTDELTERFDVVLSNHVLHHLTAAEIPSFCACCERLAIRRVVHNDIHRHDLAYALFPLTGLLFHRSFIVEDGLRSIRRAFTAEELRAIVPPGWQVTTAFPFRLRLEWVPAS